MQCLTSVMTQAKNSIQAGICEVGSSLAHLGGLLDSKVDMSQQSTAAATKANWILAASTEMSVEELEMWSFCSVLVRPHL